MNYDGIIMMSKDYDVIYLTMIVLTFYNYHLSKDYDGIISHLPTSNIFNPATFDERGARCEPPAALRRRSHTGGHRRLGASQAERHMEDVDGYVCFALYIYIYMEVSWNGGTPKSSISRWDFPL